MAGGPVQPQGAEKAKCGPDEVVDPENLLKASAALKEEGNDMIRRKRYAEAAQKYESAVAILDKADGHPMLRSDVELVVNAKAVLLSNLAQALLSQELYRRACDVATQCVNLGTDNPKALYRRALALRALKEHAKALEDVAALERLGREGRGMDQEELQRFREDVEKRHAEHQARLAEEAPDPDDECDLALVKGKERFDEIVEKYSLKDEESAEEIARYLTSAAQGHKTVTVADCSRRWGMEEDDALDFLAWIEKGVQFKKEQELAAQQFGGAA